MIGDDSAYPAGISILVAEDSHVQAETLRYLLEEEGYKVRVAGNGTEALNTVRKEKFTLIISDIKMPKMDGYELCSAVKTDPALKDIPVILLTELSDPHDIIRGLQAGADNFITKPYNDKYLLARIQHLLVNRTLRKHGTGEIALEIIFRGEKYSINPERQQILDLLISIYETALEKNSELHKVNEAQHKLIEKMTKQSEELEAAHKELREFNVLLEKRVEERTAERDKQISRHLVTIDELRKSEEKYKLLTERMTDILWTVDMEMRITYINPSVEKILGFTPEERMKQNLVETMTSESVAQIKDKLREFLEKEEHGATPESATVISFDLYKKDGSILSFENSINPIRNSLGELIGFQGISTDITERKRMNELLRENEERFRSIVETVNDWIWEMDSSGCFTYASPQITFMLGYEPYEIIGKKPLDFMPPEEAQNIEKKFNEIMGNYSPFAGLENINIKKNGEKVVFETSGVPFFDSAGNFKGYRGVDRDITLRRDADEKIRRAEKKESVLNRIAAIYLTSSDESVYFEVVNVIAEITGSSIGLLGYIDDNGSLVVKSFTGKIWDECEIKDKAYIFAPETWGDSIWGNAMRLKKSLCSNVPFKNLPDGHTQIASHVSVPVILADKVVGLLAVSNKPGDYTDSDINILESIAKYIAPIMSARIERDIKEAERKAYEDELVQHRSHLEELVADRTDELMKAHNRITAIIRSVADGVIVTDLNQKVIMMNHAAEEQLGISFQSVQGQPLSIVIQEHTLREKLKNIMYKIKTEYEFDFHLHQKHTAADRTMHGKTSVIVDGGDNILGTVTIISDVTHEREIDRMKTEFISTAAHELRTPLTSIQGFSEILLTRGNLVEDEKKKYLTYINNQAVKLAHIVGDLLDIARIESGRGFSINKEYCEMETILATIVPYFEAITSIHSFELNFTEPPVRFFADKTLMEHALKNLLANSVKYSPKGGVIKIDGKEDDGFFKVSVEDHGIGMTSDQTSRVFEKFYRADASDSAPEGTGLGMTIVKYIVEAHGGEIGIDSEYGKGTRITLAIPLKGF